MRRHQDNPYGCFRAVKANTVKIRHQCEQCAYATFMKSVLRAHISNVHGPKDFKCTQCPHTAFGTQKALEVHIRQSHGTEPQRCKICSYESMSAAFLKMHLKRVHGSDTFRCLQCSAAFTRKDSLKTHVEKAHNGCSPKIEVADHGDSDGVKNEFVMKEEIEQHAGEAASEHSGENHEDSVDFAHSDNAQSRLEEHYKNNFKCQLCNYSSDRSPELLVHINVAHQEPREISLNCEHCSFLGISLEDVEDHMSASHGGIALDACAGCGFRSNHRPIMEAHALTDTRG